MRKENTINILKALLKNPRHSDRKIATPLKLSQPTATRNRQILVKQGIIRFMGIPDLDKIGYEIMAFSLIHNPLDETVLDTINKIRGDKRIIFARSHHIGFFVISVHKNYRDFQEFALDHNVFWELLTPTSENDLKPLDYSKLPIESLSL